jgi:N-glycosylase/DNA lyase
VEYIKGVGWKEASHFLRNVGFLDVAILDKHVLRCLASLGVTDAERPTTGAVYMEKEEALHDFAASLDIPFAALDLVLWSSQTGEVLK